MSKDFSTTRTDELKVYGFKAGVVVSSTEPKFDATDLKAALFESTHSSPKTIDVKANEPHALQVTVELVRAVYVEDEAAEALPGATVYHENPDWYIEGRIQSRPQSVRIYAIAGDAQGVDEVYVQVISDTTEADGLIYHACID